MTMRDKLLREARLMIANPPRTSCQRGKAAMLLELADTFFGDCGAYGMADSEYLKVRNDLVMAISRA